MLEIQTLHAEFMKNEVSCDDVCKPNTVVRLSSVLENAYNDLSSNSRTSALWIQCVMQVNLIRQFIREERTGDWELQTLDDMQRKKHVASFTCCRSPKLC